MSTCRFSFQVQSLLLPKAGSSATECEDSIGIRKDIHRYCVADGATEAFDSRRWARLLTKQWVRSNSPLLTADPLPDWLSALGGSFRSHWAGRSLPWYAEEKARSGAHAAFAGIAFFDDHECLNWQAIAIGDSCLFHIRDGALRFAFPLDAADQFGYHPILFPSNEDQQAGAVDHVSVRGGRAEVGDVFLLLTDAIAAWYLTAITTDSDALALFDSALATEQFDLLTQFVATKRGAGQLRNDDIAAVRIAITHTEGKK